MSTTPHGQVPEALRLADDLEASSHFPGNMRSCNNAAAAELRRLHAYCQELESQVIRAGWGSPDGEHTNAELQQMLDECHEEKKKCYFALSQYKKAIENLIAERDALKAAHSVEPVYAFRRRGQDDFCTCTFKRYIELSDFPEKFEMRIFYTAQPVEQPHDK